MPVVLQRGNTPQQKAEERSYFQFLCKKCVNQPTKWLCSADEVRTSVIAGETFYLYNCITCDAETKGYPISQQQYDEIIKTQEWEDERRVILNTGVTCTHCNGTGYKIAYKEKCLFCRGIGKIRRRPKANKDGSASITPNFCFHCAYYQDGWGCMKPNPETGRPCVNPVTPTETCGDFKERDWDEPENHLPRANPEFQTLNSNQKAEKPAFFV